jgi:hypothetical protein
VIEKWECQKELGVYSRMKSRSSKSSPPSSPPSIPSLGFLTGVLSTCPSEDTSIFCQFSRFVQIIGMIVFLLAVLYTIYAFAYPYLFKKSRR